MKNDYKEYKLSNGITVYFYKDKNLKRFFASYNVNYGSSGYYDKFYYKDKPYYVKPAMAHFLEHFLIETSINGNMLLKYMDKNYDTNGLTYPEITSYYFLAIDSKDAIKESLKELIEMVEKPVFNEENIEHTKNAICEELKKGNDNKYRIAHSNNRHNTNVNFDEVPVDNNVLGSIETTRSITLEEAEACYNAYYNDENKFLVIGGNIDIDEMIDYLESIYKDIPEHPNMMREFDYSDDFNVRCKEEIIEKESDSDYVVTTYKFKRDKTLSLLKYDIYLYIYLSMKFDSGTKFIMDLNKKGIINRSIMHSSNFFKDTVTVSFSFETFKRNDAIDAIKNNLNLEDLDIEEFDLKKREIISYELRKEDYIYKCFMKFPLTIVFTKHKNDISIINELTFEEMKETISKINWDLSTTTVIKNPENSDKTAQKLE